MMQNVCLEQRGAEVTSLGRILTAYANASLTGVFGTCVVSGPRSCGKSSVVSNVLESIQRSASTAHCVVDASLCSSAQRVLQSIVFGVISAASDERPIEALLPSSPLVSVDDQDMNIGYRHTSRDAAMKACARLQKCERSDVSDSEDDSDSDDFAVSDNSCVVNSEARKLFNQVNNSLVSVTKTLKESQCGAKVTFLRKFVSALSKLAHRGKRAVIVIDKAERLFDSPTSIAVTRLICSLRSIIPKFLTTDPPASCFILLVCGTDASMPPAEVVSLTQGHIHFPAYTHEQCHVSLSAAVLKHTGWSAAKSEAFARTALGLVYFRLRDDFANMVRVCCNAASRYDSKFKNSGDSLDLTKAKAVVTETCFGSNSFGALGQLGAPLSASKTLSLKDSVLGETMSFGMMVLLVGAYLAAHNSPGDDAKLTSLGELSRRHKTRKGASASSQSVASERPSMVFPYSRLRKIHRYLSYGKGYDGADDCVTDSAGFDNDLLSLLSLGFLRQVTSKDKTLNGLSGDIFDSLPLVEEQNDWDDGIGSSDSETEINDTETTRNPGSTRTPGNKSSTTSAMGVSSLATEISEFHVDGRGNGRSLRFASAIPAGLVAEASRRVGINLHEVLSGA